MKKLIYIFMALTMFSCSGYGDVVMNGKQQEEQTTEEKKDSTGWANVIRKHLRFHGMYAHASIDFHRTNGVQDSIQMEDWLLYIGTNDTVIYRDNYQPTIASGIIPDAKRHSDPEFKDKYGNLVVRHYYTQEFKFNNFTHSISGAWNTGRIITNNGKEENYLPEGGLSYSISSLDGVGDTTQFVRNDSIFCIEKISIEYEITLYEVANDPRKKDTWTRKANIDVISFIGIQEKIPTADFYVSNLQWHATSGNRFFKKIGEDKDGDIGNWEDGFLMSTDTHYIMLIVHYTVDAKDGKSDERYNGTELFSIEKSAMATPVAGREYNAVMYDYTRGKYIPCCLSKDYNFSYGSKYADGTPVTFKPDINGSIMAGVKNFAKDKDASPSPWLEGGCTPTPYKGDKNYYTITLKSSVHTNVTTVADASLKK